MGLFWAWLLLAMVAATGCKRAIGDECTSSTNCSLTGDRLCDVTQPAGYCTVFNCEPNNCPEEAACVSFNESSCSSPALSGRFQRTFCLLSCEGNDDCRSGYECIDTTGDPSRQIVDTNPSSRRVCAVPRSGAPVPPFDPPVCYPSDASFDSGPPPFEPDTGPAPEASGGDAVLDTAEDGQADALSDGSESSADAEDSGADVESDALGDEMSDATAD